LRNRQIVLALGIVAAALAIWLVRARLTEPPPGRADPTERSANVPRDIARMWETQPLTGDSGPRGREARGSTDGAINAASRVFNTVQLAGNSRAEVLKLLGDPRASNDSVYNFPFWPAPAGSLVYRFDCGNYGWQFNVLLDDDDWVSTVERHWIH
jgi:hypothetical protein